MFYKFETRRIEIEILEVNWKFTDESPPRPFVVVSIGLFPFLYFQFFLPPPRCLIFISFYCTTNIHINQRYKYFNGIFNIDFSIVYGKMALLRGNRPSSRRQRIDMRNWIEFNLACKLATTRNTKFEFMSFLEFPVASFRYLTWFFF